MDLETIRNSFHQQYLNHRNVDNLLNTDNFSIAFAEATKEDKKDLEKAIERADKKYLNSFILTKLQNKTPFHRMGLKALRDIAKNVSIPRYHILPKQTLIEEIEDVAKRLKKSG